MFIANVAKGGGYRTDVNTAFRQGRQDAFRDYVDNFDFALKADAANNAENQRQVERLARNYGLQLGMQQAGRNAAINFVNDIGKIEQARSDLGTNLTFLQNRDPNQLGQEKAQLEQNVSTGKTQQAEQASRQAGFDNQVNQATLSNLDPQQLGGSMANSTYNGTVAKELETGNAVTGQQNLSEFQVLNKRLRELNNNDYVKSLYDSAYKKAAEQYYPNDPDGVTKLMNNKQQLDAINNYVGQQLDSEKASVSNQLGLLTQALGGKQQEPKQEKEYNPRSPTIETSELVGKDLQEQIDYLNSKGGYEANPTSNTITYVQGNQVLHFRYPSTKDYQAALATLENNQQGGSNAFSNVYK